MVEARKTTLTGARPRKVITVVAPARAISRETAERVTNFAQTALGDGAPHITFHGQCFKRLGHFAGSDDDRAAAFREVANDPSVDAIWFARGGYGSGRIVESVSTLTEVAKQKTYVGYSDLGFLMGRLYADKIGRLAHGPMPHDIERPGGEAAIQRVLSWLARDAVDGYEGSVMDGAPSVAFNITVLAHMAGASWAPNLAGCVLLLEDVGEYLYQIDRSCAAIFSSNIARGLLGVRLGRVSDVPVNDPEFGLSAEEIVTHWTQKAGVPYLGRCDIGHDTNNKIVVFPTPRPNPDGAANS